MGVFQHIGIGIKSYGSAWSFIAKHRQWHFFVYPTLISIGFFFLVLWGVWQSLSSFDQIILTSTDQWADRASWWYSWFAHSIAWIVGLLMNVFGVLKILLIFYLYYTFNKWFVLLLMSPILGYISEKTEFLLTGQEYTFDLLQLLKDMIRGVYISIRNAILELTFTLLLLLLNIIPVLGTFIGSFLTFTIGCYYVGFTVIDYVNERKRLTTKDRLAIGRQLRGLAIGNGFMLEFIVLVPILGPIIGPVLSTVGGTIALHEIIGLQKKEL